MTPDATRSQANRLVPLPRASASTPTDPATAANVAPPATLRSPRGVARGERSSSTRRAELRRPASVATDVALFEARRLVLHPLVLLGLAWYLALLVATADDGPVATFGVLTTGPTFFTGVFTYFAANLIASRVRRHHCAEHHASLPSTPVARTAGLCLATLAPAALVSVITLVALGWHVAVVDTFVEPPTMAEMAAGPLSIIGGGLLGVMIARWLPFPTASIIVMVGIVALTMWLNSRPETWQMLAPYVSFSRWTDSGTWGGRYPGSAEWHAVYLVALCAMAATGALLTEARRKLPVLAIGALFTTAAVVAGVVQLP